MSNHRFILENYKGKSTRYTCPECHGKHEFTRYIDLNKSEYVHPDVGICNNANKCGYHYPPKDYFRDNKQVSNSQRTIIQKPKFPIKLKNTNKPTSFFNPDILKKYNKHYGNNTFYLAFKDLCGDELLSSLELYKVGTVPSTYMEGAIIYWQIDLQERVRTGKLILYDIQKGKRKLQNWYHSIKKLKQFNLKQVPFGLHLLKRYPHKKIAIVEGEKTALLMNIANPSFNWLAVGSCQNLTHWMLSDIKNKDVILYPDAGKYKLWYQKIKTLPKSNFYSISSLLDKYATEEEKNEDFDIADYYIRILSDINQT